MRLATIDRLSTLSPDITPESVSWADAQPRSPWRRARSTRPAHRPSFQPLDPRPAPRPARLGWAAPATEGSSPADVEQAVKRAVALALSAERQRMAADLHDDLGGALAVLAQRSTDPLLAGVARTALSNMRGLLRGCVDESTPFVDTCADLRAEVARLCEASGTQLNWLVCGESSLVNPNPGARLHIQRVLREAVTNALRHGRCTQLTVTLRIDPQALKLTVVDNGCGFDIDNRETTQSGHGLGLSAMRTRAERLGGSVSLASQLGVGTQLFCTMPV